MRAIPQNPGSSECWSELAVVGSGRSSNRSRRKVRRSLSSRLLVFRCCSSLSNLNCTIRRACTRRSDLAVAAAPRSASISLLASAMASTKSRTYWWAFSTLSNGVWRGLFKGESSLANGKSGGEGGTCSLTPHLPHATYRHLYEHRKPKSHY